MKRLNLKKFASKEIIFYLLIGVALFMAVIYLIKTEDLNLNKVYAFIGSKPNEIQIIPKEWLAKYGLENATLDDLKKDIDKDGLNLAHEFKYSTNPLKSDSDGDGKRDGDEIRSGGNPNGSGRIDSDNDKIPDYWEKKFGLDLKKDDSLEDPDNDGLPNYLEYVHLTDPLHPDTDKDGRSDGKEIKNGFDPSKPGSAKPAGRIIITKLNVEAPIIFSESDVEEDMQKDLQEGVSMYPETAPPGQRGNSVLSGHSSNYDWEDGDYKEIFKEINALEKGDEVVVTMTQDNNRIIRYAFEVTEKDIVKADDKKIFEETNTPIITLVTCWPIGTSWKRLIIKAELK